jgi:Spy/CpxP family protein refolding chaperone
MTTATTFFSTRGLRATVGALVVALAGGVGLAAFAQDGGPHGHAPHEMFMGPPLMGRGLDHMLDAVNATDAQRAQIKQIADAAAADLKAQHEAAKGLHEQAMTLFTQPVVDANAAEALRQQMLQQHDQASKRMLQAMLDVSRVLTPEQRQQLAQKMKQHHEMMQRHMQERSKQG